MFSSSELVHQLLDIDAIFRRGQQLQKRNKKKKFVTPAMPAGLEGSAEFWGLALETEDQPAARGAGEGVAEAAETLKTEKQSRALKQDTEKEEEREGMKRRKKGKE